MLFIFTLRILGSHLFKHLENTFISAAAAAWPANIPKALSSKRCSRGRCVCTAGRKQESPAGGTQRMPWWYRRSAWCSAGRVRESHVFLLGFIEKTLMRGAVGHPGNPSWRPVKRKEKQMFNLMLSEYLKNRPPDLCVIGQECTAEERILKCHYLCFSDVIEHHAGWECSQKDFLLLMTLFHAFVSLFIIGFLRKMAVCTEKKSGDTRRLPVDLSCSFWEILWIDPDTPLLFSTFSCLFLFTAVNTIIPSRDLFRQCTLPSH